MKEFRRTKSVRLLLGEFEESNKALSVKDLVETFQSNMNRTTVYRILDRLEGSGVLHSFAGKDGVKWYAKHDQSIISDQNSVHPHFQCQECGKTECLSIDITIPFMPNYNVASANLLLAGQCKDCIS